MSLTKAINNKKQPKQWVVVKTTVSKWVTQLKPERNGQSPTASPMTPEQIEIWELKKQIQRIELGKDISKKLPLSLCPTP
ncbi:hypothetical protein H5117_02380 [Pseudoalteromonas sp. SG45-1]|nr:hypothetical protein [Pseudoalteromonas sp. SG45-1]